MNFLPLLICSNFVIYPFSTHVIQCEHEYSFNTIKASFDSFNGDLLAVTKINNKENNFVLEDLNTYGCLSKMMKFSEKDFGDSKSARVVGASRIKINNIYFDEKLGCYFAEYEIANETLTDEITEQRAVEDIVNSITESGSFKDRNPRINSFFEALKRGVDGIRLSYLLADSFPFPLSEALSFLNEENVTIRLKLLNESLKKLILSVKYDEEIDAKLRESAEKNQKDYFLREKMRIIKQELGDEDNVLDDNEKIKQQIENGNYPEHVKTKLKEEVKKYNMMPSASLEASLIRNYIDIVMSIPWVNKTTDNNDLENVKKILDEDHYGLEKVKKRIIEYLAVKSKTGNLKSPILCFYGPPGVGKTSLGRSIARALGRSFVKSSLGGVNDESEIRGHRRTYVGSMPGRIIQGIRKGKTANPLFLLDEIDKVSSNYKGDPASALLEVLDPEQNFSFYDNFVEEPYDLSDVLFICTANYLENIPAPLRDRLELIQVDSYTLIEKQHIASEHLIKKQIEANGLSTKDLEFTDEAITYIIEKYTREAGVRDLERKIGAICRQICVNIVSKKQKGKAKITIKKVKEILGTEIFDSTEKESENQIGVVTGLAYTEFGGDILPIEVTSFKGKGNLILTGKLGDVMKESCSIALDYVKANADKYNIDYAAFDNIDIHIHFPEGAVPKDGPSAGCAITTALISSFTNRPAQCDVAMTGEVTLRGKALPIGGLREKSLAALRNGIKTIIIPKANKKDVDDLPKEVKDNLHIIYMESVETAVKNTLL